MPTPSSSSAAAHHLPHSKAHTDVTDFWDSAERLCQQLIQTFQTSSRGFIICDYLHQNKFICIICAKNDADKLFFDAHNLRNLCIFASVYCEYENGVFMHIFDYKKLPEKLLTPAIVNQLSILHEFRGKQDLYISAKSDVLSALLDIAKIQSTKASNGIEGILTSDDRLQALVMEKAEPQSRSEEEIAGYREVLATIHENYEYIPLRSNAVLQLHRDLYSYGGKGIGGRFKNVDNIIAEVDKGGYERVRFTPTPAFQTPDAMENLCQTFNEALDDGKYDALLLITMFILDFLCVHPFSDGNGRMSRLLTLLLLYRSNYIVGKYISIEMMIERSKETYYEALRQSSIGWHTGENDYQPFVSYYLGVFVKAYQEFQDRVEHLHGKPLSKTERIRNVFSKRIGKITKSDIATLCPDISLTTIERTLKEMLDNGEIKKIGSGRGTAYLINS